MKSKNILFLAALVSIPCLLLVGCSGTLFKNSKNYLSSGTIILSRTIEKADGHAPGAFAPLLGYIPPATAFVPAQNETWVQLNRNTKTLSIFKGKTKVKEIKGEGDVDLEPGVYSLQFKQKDPSWYAPDDYFTKRRLPVPPAGDPLRFRKGALGQYAIYPTPNFKIHSGAVWTKEVGGLRVSRSDLSSVYYLLPLGASVKVE